MENKKFEQLIDLIINEQEDRAKELFHEIVVEKSREIYESIMDEEMMDTEESSMVGEVGDLMDEISAEESGDVVEAEDEADIDFDDEAEEAGDDLTGDLEADHDEEGSVDKADLGDIKDKLDDLMAEFESLMSGDADMGDEEEVEDDMMEMSDDAMEEEVMEAVQLQKVSVTHGDNGAQTKSPVTANSGAKGMDSKPVKFAGAAESVPNGPKGPSNEYSKKEGDLPGAGSFKNVPGGKAKVDLTAAPKPVTKDGSANSKSIVAKG
jgi:hypothetical protein